MSDDFLRNPYLPTFFHQCVRICTDFFGVRLRNVMNRFWDKINRLRNKMNKLWNEMNPVRCQISAPERIILEKNPYFIRIFFICNFDANSIDVFCHQSCIYSFIHFLEDWEDLKRFQKLGKSDLPTFWSLSKSFRSLGGGELRRNF